MEHLEVALNELESAGLAQEIGLCYYVLELV